MTSITPCDLCQKSAGYIHILESENSQLRHQVAVKETRVERLRDKLQELEAKLRFIERAASVDENTSLSVAVNETTVVFATSCEEDDDDENNDSLHIEEDVKANAEPPASAVITVKKELQPRADNVTSDDIQAAKKHTMSKKRKRRLKVTAKVHCNRRSRRLQKLSSTLDPPSDRDGDGLDNEPEEPDVNKLPEKSTHRPFKCAPCGKGFKTSASYSQHKLYCQHKAGKNFHCVECNRSFSSSFWYNTHVNSHLGIKPHKCSSCDATFTHETSLTRHMRQHEEANGKTRRRECVHCRKSFAAASDLRKHERIHTGEKPFPCLTCGRAFGDSSSLTRHMRIHTGEKPYGCDKCHKTFACQSHCTRHQRCHTGEKPFLCSYCSKAFSQSNNLKAHIRQHTGTPPNKHITCPVCKKLFWSQRDLSDHIKIHTGEKPYLCPRCGKAFRWTYSLRVHLKIHTGDKPYKCENCSKGFHQASDLKRHLRIHTGEKPYRCIHCAKGFTQSTTLQKHLKSHEKLNAKSQLAAEKEAASAKAAAVSADAKQPTHPPTNITAPTPPQSVPSVADNKMTESSMAFSYTAALSSVYAPSLSSATYTAQTLPQLQLLPNQSSSLPTSCNTHLGEGFYSQAHPQSQFVGNAPMQMDTPLASQSPAAQAHIQEQTQQQSQVNLLSQAPSHTSAVQDPDVKLSQLSQLSQVFPYRASSSLYSLPVQNMPPPIPLGQSGVILTHGATEDMLQSKQDQLGATGNLFPASSLSQASSTAALAPQLGALYMMAGQGMLQPTNPSEMLAIEAPRYAKLEGYPFHTNQQMGSNVTGNQVGSQVNGLAAFASQPM